MRDVVEELRAFERPRRLHGRRAPRGAVAARRPARARLRRVGGDASGSGRSGPGRSSGTPRSAWPTSLAPTAVPVVAGGVRAGPGLVAGRSAAVCARLFYRRATEMVVVEPPGRRDRACGWSRTRTPPAAAPAFRERWRRWTRRLAACRGCRRRAAAAVAMSARCAGRASREAGSARAAGPDRRAARRSPPSRWTRVLSDWTPGARRRGRASRVALALHEELTRRPPARLSVGLVLAGAGRRGRWASSAGGRREAGRPPTPSSSSSARAGPGPSAGRRGTRSSSPPCGAGAAAARAPGARSTRSPPSRLLRCVGPGGVAAPGPLRARHRRRRSTRPPSTPPTTSCSETVDTLDALLSSSATTASAVELNVLPREAHRRRSLAAVARGRGRGRRGRRRGRDGRR